MSREIKFRVWDKYTKEMICNEVFGNCIDYYCYYYCFDENGLNFGKATPGGDCFDFTEVMQYTELKDKNGKEIYEGDIVQFYNDEKYQFTPGYAQVIFEDGAYYIKHYEYGTMLLNECDMDDMCLVIAGNIYENPELLEGGIDIEKGRFR